MTWIGGIFSKTHINQDDLRKRLALMMETACPASKPSTGAEPLSFSSIFDGVRGQALVTVSHSTAGTPSERFCIDHQAKLALVYDGHFYRLDRAVAKLSRAQHGVNETSAESLVHLLAALPGSLEQKVRRALTMVDGHYALAVSDGDRMVISRDYLGTKPVYFAENHESSAFASNKRPLWKMGLGEVRPLRAGMIAVFNHDSINIREASSRRNRQIGIDNMAQAVAGYEQALRSALNKRLAAIDHLPKTGVLLSGGVDSCLIARLLQEAAGDLGVEVVAYSAGLPNSPDVKFAREFAAELGIKHEIRILSIDQVEQYTHRVIEAIEDSDFVQVETGIGLCAAIDMASQNGVEAVFSGQGPDELWGGYSWYPKVLGKNGRQELCRRMRDDFARVDIETLDRENKIATAYGVELFYPYLDTKVVNVAMSVASELKVISEKDSLGKHPHRQVAIKTGISERYANREKLAIQHGTGIHGVLDGVARRNGFDPALVKDTGYRSGKITTVKMGSSARYGYRYAENKLWQVPQHVQFFFHAIAYGKGLLDESTRDRVGYFLDKARLSSRVSF